MIYKEVPLFQLEINPLYKLPTPCIEFVSEDIGTSKMNIQVMNNGAPVNLTGYIPTFKVKKADGKYVEQNLNNGLSYINITTGILAIILVDQAITAQGLTYCEINFSDGINDFTTQKFRYLVRSSLSSYSSMASTNLIPLEIAIEYAESQRINAEAIRQSIESTRVSSENTRVTNENTRTSNESIRVTNENIRQTSESSRQTSYLNMNTRIDNLVVGAGGNSPIEVTDAHVSAVKSKTFTTLDARFEEAESSIPQITDTSTNKKYTFKIQVNSGKPQLIYTEVI